MELKQIRTLLEISHSEEIMRRYFVVNGYDGALTMLGLIMGFYVSDSVDLAVVITSCLAAALALGMSGISSAYISEAAERRRILEQLEGAMVTSLDESHHARAVIWIPWLVALVNGIAPLLIALIIIIPLWLARSGVVLVFGPDHCSAGTGSEEHACGTDGTHFCRVPENFACVHHGFSRGYCLRIVQRCHWDRCQPDPAGNDQSTPAYRAERDNGCHIAGGIDEHHCSGAEQFRHIGGR